MGQNLRRLHEYVFQAVRRKSVGADMSITAAIQKIRKAGFSIEADGDAIAIQPFDELTDVQVDWLKTNKPDILSALKSEGAILETNQAGNDVPPANDPDRVLIHVPYLGLSTGRRISCDMTVPRASLDKLRAVLRFKLKDSGGGGSLLGEPGRTGAELREILVEKYGKRLATIDGLAP